MVAIDRLQSAKMSEGVPLHVTLEIWCYLDLFINTFLLVNLTYGHIIIYQGLIFEHPLFPPHFVVRIFGFVTLTSAILSDIFNLIAVQMKSLKLLVAWQISFISYIVLAYVTLITSLMDVMHTLMKSEVIPEWSGISNFH